MGEDEVPNTGHKIRYKEGYSLFHHKILIMILGPRWFLL